METKTCRGCGETKDIKEFHRASRFRDGRQSRCKACHAEYNRVHYKNNKRDYHESSERERIRLREWFENIKAQTHCSRCGEDKPWRLEFHHPDPNVKDGSVTTLLWNTRSKMRVLEEIKKCEVVCRNCHADIHWGPYQIEHT